MYQTRFSKYIELTDEKERFWMEEELHERQEAAYRAGAGFFAFQMKERGVWIHSSRKNPFVDDLAEVEMFLQDFLIRFRPDEIISIEYAFCADDEQFTQNEQVFGGGASVVTAHEVCTITTDIWIEQQLRSLRGRRTTD